MLGLERFPITRLELDTWKRSALDLRVASFHTNSIVFRYLCFDALISQLSLGRPRPHWLRVSSFQNVVVDVNTLLTPRLWPGERQQRGNDPKGCDGSADR